jgi:hypothetical protein
LLGRAIESEQFCDWHFQVTRDPVSVSKDGAFRPRAIRLRKSTEILNYFGEAFLTHFGGAIAVLGDGRPNLW